MIGPEHVRARRQGSELRLRPLEGKLEERALELAAELLAAASGAVGRTRGELEEELAAVAAAPGERKLCDGLAKLVLDACVIEQQTAHEPAELRRALFAAAAAARRTLGPGERFDRRGVIDNIAKELDIAPAELEAGLYADLKAAHVVHDAPRLAPRALVERYARAEVQAVLLRAVRVTALVRCGSPLVARELFRKLKFRRLLHRIERHDDGRYRIEIDGPFSLFESVTKYGLQLALVLPALEECDELELTAELRWGKQREPLRFRHAHRLVGPRRGAPAELVDEVRALLDAINAMDTPWRAVPAPHILDLPGVGLCVPDLMLCHGESGDSVYLEALGYWSRDAVFKRVELAERGLADKILFCASSRLRVSEELLDGVESAALYVYKGVMSPRAVVQRAEALLKTDPG